MRFLNALYPKPFNNGKLIVVISLFVTLFLMVFQPFGLSQWTSGWKWWVLLGYGGVTAVVLVLNLVVLQKAIPGWFEEKRWTVSKEIIFLLWILFWIGTGNFFYTTLFFDLVGSLIRFQMYTLSIGILPVAGITLVNQNIQWKRNYKKAQELNGMIPDLQKDERSANIELVSENNKKELEVNVGNLLFVESTGNYVKVHYLNNGEYTAKLIRNTLKRTEEQLYAFEHIVKCHRAFLVNVDKVTKVAGNAQGLTLNLSNISAAVPVARSYVPVIKSLLE